MQSSKSTPELTVRKYRPADAERVREVHERALRDAGAYVDGVSDDELADVQGASLDGGAGAHFLLGTHEGTIIATGAYRPLAEQTASTYQSLRKPAAELCLVRVDPDFQRQGFGRRICADLERRAREHGYQELVLDTDLHNDGARAFFEAIGFERATTVTVDVDAGEFGLALYRKRLRG